MAALKSARLWMGSLVICTWAASAQAQECEKNEDCPKGLRCEVGMDTSDCAEAPPCAPNAKCPEPPPCAAAEESRSCQPGPCATDADCGDGMVCFKEKLNVCSGSGSSGAPACAPGDDCPMPAPPPPDECRETELALCVPRYVLPCEQDSDCGEGFTCEAGEECMCSGSAGGYADAGSAEPMAGQNDFAPRPADAGVDRPAPPPPREVCECRPTERKHCELKPMACSSDQDCPGDFVCKSNGDAAVSCTASDAGVCESDPVPPSERSCQPRYDAPTRGGSKGDDASSDDPTYEGADAGAAPPQLPGDGESAPVEDKSTCSVTTPRAGSLGSLLAPLALLMLALGVRARRKHR